MHVFLFLLWRLLTALPVNVLVSLGFGYVSYKGYAFLVDGFISNVVVSLNNISSDVYEIVSMCGFIDGIGIYLGALASTAAMSFVDRLTRLPS